MPLLRMENDDESHNEFKLAVKTTWTNLQNSRNPVFGTTTQILTCILGANLYMLDRSHAIWKNPRINRILFEPFDRPHRCCNINLISIYLPRCLFHARGTDKSKPTAKSNKIAILSKMQIQQTILLKKYTRICHIVSEHTKYFIRQGISQNMEYKL